MLGLELELFKLDLRGLPLLRMMGPPVEDALLSNTGVEAVRGKEGRGLSLPFNGGVRVPVVGVGDLTWNETPPTVSIDAVRLRGGLIVRGNGSVLGCIVVVAAALLVVVEVGEGLNGMFNAGFVLGILSFNGGRPLASSSSSSSLGRFFGLPGGVGLILI